jgi:hypothetical protein
MPEQGVQDACAERVKATDLEPAITAHSSNTVPLLQLALLAQHVVFIPFCFSCLM